MRKMRERMREERECEYGRGEGTEVRKERKSR